VTTTTHTTPVGNPANPRRGMHVLLNDDLGRLMLRRLKPWHRMAARCRAPRLDRELAGGTSPEASASLAARAMRLTSMRFRHDLAASVQRILVAAGQPPAVLPAPPVAGHPPHVPICRARISQSAPLLAELAGHLAGPGPVPVRGVAMVSQLLADGTGPLYHQACRDDLAAIIERATQALTV
jgi:hypothetical protein